MYSAPMLLLLACVPPLVAASEPPVLDEAEVHWFTLEGADRIDLLESCLDRCPTDERGVAVASLTTWQLRWNWTQAPSDPCAIADTSVDARVSVALPRWDPPPEADPALVAEWDRWHARLRYHEQGHVDVVRGFAQDAEARLAAAGCTNVVAEADALMDGLRAAQNEYDVATGSGHTQGAAFWGTQGRALAAE